MQKHIQNNTNNSNEQLTQTNKQYKHTHKFCSLRNNTAVHRNDHNFGDTIKKMSKFTTILF